jgi:hypothetical protein
VKIKLTPELAYIIGLWRKCRTKEGIGVHGPQDLLEIFSKEVIEKGLTTADKMLSGEKKVYFYHSKYRKFFQKVEEEQCERFKYLNEYAANYLAGLFDCVGEIDDKGFVYINNANTNDEILLIRLGFGARRKNKHVVIEKPAAFLAFIKNYVKRFNGHPAFEYTKKKKAGHRDQQKVDDL